MRPTKYNVLDTLYIDDEEYTITDISLECESGCVTEKIRLARYLGKTKREQLLDILRKGGDIDTVTDKIFEVFQDD